MKDKKTSAILKEYYNIISPLLPFTANDTLRETEHNILLLLCKSMGCEEIIYECTSLIDDARQLQTVGDCALLMTTDNVQPNIAIDIKTEVLERNKISILRNFNESAFTEALKNAANIGDKNSCKLLAFLSWLGLIVEQNKNAAQNIWATLSMSGDAHSLEMLIFAYEQNGNTEAQQKWKNIRNIIQNEFDSFSAVALYSAYPEYSTQEIQTANLIMFISQKYSSNSAINRPLLYYALNSKDDYKTKMERLSSETNYYIALHNEDNAEKKHCGFLIPCLE